MRCRRARAALVEWTAGRLHAAQRQALEAHVGECAGCAREAAEERNLATDLARLRATPSPRVEVSARVMAEVSRLPDSDRRDVPFGHVAWAAASAAAVLVLAVGVAVLAFPPALPRAVHETRWILGGLGAVVPAVGTFVSALGLVLRGVGTVLFELAEALLRVLETVAPAGPAVAGLSLLAMVLAWMALIGKDLRPLAAASIRKER